MNLNQNSLPQLNGLRPGLEVDVSILIISYNTKEFTLGCLRSVYRQTSGVTFETVVIDNASDDGSVAAIKGEFPEVTLVELPANVGFAKGNNLAASIAKGTFLLLLNPDTVILDHAVETICNFASKHLEAGIMGGRTFFGDMQLNRNSCHGRQTIWSMTCMGTGLASAFRKSAFFNPEALGDWERDDVRDVDAVTGCFLLISRALWDKLGGLDESFFYVRGGYRFMHQGLEDRA